MARVASDAYALLGLRQPEMGVARAEEGAPRRRRRASQVIGQGADHEIETLSEEEVRVLFRT